MDDPTADPAKVERVVLCTGKLYYDLLAKKEELNDDKAVIVSENIRAQNAMAKITEIMGKE